MTDSTDFLRSVPLFARLSDEAFEEIAGLAQEVAWTEGDDVLADGHRALYVLLDGEVELYLAVGGIEKLFMAVQTGGMLGLLSMFDPQPLQGHARPTVATRALEISREALDGLLERHPHAGAQLLDGIGAVLGQRVRVLNEMYEAALTWNLEVTGLASLNLERLLTDRVGVEVETSRGQILSGLLLRFEASAAGHELYLQTTDRQVHIIPYHAIVRVSVDAELARTDEESA